MKRKANDILESEQGKFAKVIKMKESLTYFSAWVKSKALAEKETVAVNRLNEFGLSQVLKKGKNIGVGDATVEVEPAKEEKKESKTDSKKK